MDPLVTELLWKGIALALVLAGMLWAWWIKRRMRDKRGRMPAVVDALGKPIPGSTKTEKSFQGITYQYEHHAGNDGIPSYLVLTIIGKSAGDYLILKSGEKASFAQWLKRRGITYVNSGDPDFDESVDITTDKTPTFAKSCLQIAHVREAVISLVDMGFTAVRNDGKGIDAVRMNVDIVEGELDTIVPEAINRLHILFDHSANMRPHRILGVSCDKWGWPGACLVPAIAMVSVFAAGYVLYLQNARHVGGPSYVIESIVTAPALLIWLFLSYWMIRGRAKSAIYVIGVWMASIMSFILAGFIWILALNTALDRGPVSLYIQSILNVERQSDLDTGYDVEVASWRPGKDVERIFISHAECRKSDVPIVMARKLEIETKPGFFGYEWICAVRLLVDNAE